MIFESKDLLINQKNLPDKDSDEYNEFWKAERKKCKEGITIDGVFINPFLYWHCNLWTIITDHITKGRIRQKPDFRDSEWILTNKIWEAKNFKDENGNLRRKGVIAAGTRRFSKALEHGSKLYTQDGTINIEDICVGDFIFGADGKPTKVTGVFPQGEKDIYEISLLDGRKLYCCEDHLWYLQTKKTGKKDRHGDKFVTMNTKELISKYKRERKNSYKPGEKCFEYLYSIPNNAPVEYSFKDLEIDPYFLGLWLGDGSNKSPDITSIDNEIIDYVKIYAETLNLVVKEDGITYRITSGIKGGNNKTLKDKNILLVLLRKLNLIHNKHIPKEYLYSSIEQRIELLKGLMDTDGTISKLGDCSFTTTSEQLADDFYFLCRSLGINLKRTVRESYYTKNGGRIKCKNAYHFQLYINFAPFKLSRKIERFKFSKGDLSKINKTRIVNIQKVRKNLATCITVANEDKLFLTDNFTVTHNSELEASFCAWEAVCWKNSQVVVSGLNEPDIKIITDKIDLGINELPDFFMKSKIEDNWKKQVTLGIKDAKTNQRIPWSSFAIRNFDGGDNEEALAGLTPTAGVIDEGGKGNFLKALLAGLPGLTTPNGWRGTFLVMGTGGDMDSFRDFQTLFDNPESYNFLACEVPDESRKCGLFLPGWMSYAYPKHEKSFAEYLGVDEKKHPNLKNVKILASDKKENETLIDKERENLKESKDSSALLKHTMYFPKTTREIFLSQSNNKFNVPGLKMHQITLEKYNPVYADLFRNTEGKVNWTFSDKKPIIKFPVGPKDQKEAPLCIFEHPIENVPHGTYCIGIDPINNDDSNDGEVSLASIVVYKRMISPLDQFKNQPVATWAGRFTTLEEFHELALMIAEFYNAVDGVIIEDSERTLLQYFYHKRKSHFLADTTDLLTHVNPKYRGNKKMGFPATTINQKHGMNLLVEYVNTEDIIVTEEGEEIYQLGLTRILDTMLCQELIQYKGKTSGRGVHDGNFDRIISMYCALTLAQFYDIKYPITSTPKKKPTLFQVIESQTPSIKTPFGTFKQGTRMSTPRWLRGRG